MEIFRESTLQDWLLRLGFLLDVCLRHVRPFGTDKNQLFEWLLFVIHRLRLVLFASSRGGERGTTEFLGCRHKWVGFSLQPNVSSGHFIWRDLLLPSEEVRQTMALAWRVKSVLLLHRHVAFLLLRLPHLSLHSLPACLPTCFTAPSPLRPESAARWEETHSTYWQAGNQKLYGSFCCKTGRLKKIKGKLLSGLKGGGLTCTLAHTHTAARLHELLAADTRILQPDTGDGLDAGSRQREAPCFLPV